ncbi:PREDICTED: uncharacterized protein LOC109168298 [Ipomoea nil]|uniref:uncharacterized protein LOC109168298 n=1 Tax=Ipomoea nil TaxID=35883 RepID=UPI000900CE2A|nr:PREDICTED: uncharacterized protein LOC109168298 [Ipomoea nil]
MMTRGGSRVGRIRGRGRGASVTLPSSSPSSSALPSPVAPIVAPPPAIVSPAIVSPASIGSPPELPIPSPSDSTAPPTSSSVAGSSTACDLPIVHIEDGSGLNFKRSLICLSTLRIPTKRRMIHSLMRGQSKSLTKYKHDVML